MSAACFERLLSPWGAFFLLVGAFYVFAGWFAFRHLRTELLVDRALDMISGQKPARSDRARNAWLIVGGIVTFAAGASLVALSSLAIWLFVFGFVQQVAYITIVAPRYFDVDDPPDPRGRRQTTNAAAIFGIVALAVVFAGARGALLPIAGQGMPSTLAVLIATLAFCVWAAFGLKVSRGTGTPFDAFRGGQEAEPDEGDDIALEDIVAIRLEAAIGDYPMEIDLADGDTCRHPPSALFDGQLAEDLAGWEERYLAIFDPPDPALARDWTPQEKHDHFAVAADLARRMRALLLETGFDRITVRYAGLDGDWGEAE